MTQSATSLGPKPSLLFCLLWVVFVCFGGFKGQERWPKGPPHLALNPPYFSFFICFPFFAFNRKHVSSLSKRAFLFICLYLPLFLFSPFLASPFFTFSSLCLSLVLSFFLPSFLFLMSVSGFCFLFLFCLLFSFKMFFCCCFSVSCFVLFGITIICIHISMAICIFLFWLCILLSCCFCCLL